MRAVDVHVRHDEEARVGQPARALGGVRRVELQAEDAQQLERLLVPEDGLGALAAHVEELAADGVDAKVLARDHREARGRKVLGGVALGDDERRGAAVEREGGVVLGDARVARGGGGGGGARGHRVAARARRGEGALGEGAALGAARKVRRPLPPPPQSRTGASRQRLLWSVKRSRSTRRTATTTHCACTKAGVTRRASASAPASARRLGLDEVGDLGEEVSWLPSPHGVPLTKAGGEAGAEGAGGGRRALGARRPRGGGGARPSPDRRRRRRAPRRRGRGRSARACARSAAPL